jgi:NAD(P)-dependent dehydrogenase (short-subunit alcohol dehydrogenase family)
VNKLFDLSGRSAIITGASSGLGRRFAELLAGAGVQVVAGARRTQHLAKLIDDLGEHGHRVKAFDLDVTDSTSVTRFFENCRDSKYAIDILINNAGVAVTNPITEQSEADWDSVVDTNLKGAWLMTQHLVRYENRGSPCTIINVASVLGFQGSNQLAPYCASKAGLVNLTRALAIELARYEIRVNAIAPGYVETEMNRDFLTSPASEKIRKRIPLGAFGRPEDLDGSLLYLCSDASRYVTGSTITIDGGLSAGL